MEKACQGGQSVKSQELINVCLFVFLSLPPITLVVQVWAFKQ